MLKGKNHDDGIIIIEVPEFLRILFTKMSYIYIPSWVDGEVDAFSPKKSGSVQTDLRRIKKHELSYEVTDELNQFDNFYNHMHLPYIAEAFGRKAVILSHDYMKNEFGKHGLYNDLLLIKKEEEYIAGMLLGYNKWGIYLHPLGVKDGNFDYVKDGAIGALFYFPLQISKKMGYRKVNFGLTRAFLKDGVFQFKKKRGVKIVGSSKMGFILKPLSMSAAIRGFLSNNPFVHIDERGFNGAVFIENDRPLSEEDFMRIYKEYYSPGMVKLFIYRIGKVDKKTEDVVPADIADSIKLDSARNLFFKIAHTF
jgi:hypothetical protein